MTESIDVTVSIVNHATRDDLLECLRSLHDDPERRCSSEVIVVDNASDDGSVYAVRARYPDVQIIENKLRLGFGANHNQVARLSQAEFILFLNPDTLVRPGALDALVGHLVEHPEVGVVGPLIYGADGELETYLLPFPTLRTALLAAMRPWHPLRSWQGRAITQVDWVNGCAFMVRRAELIKLGGFDEGFFLYGEEKDLCRRFARTGLETHICARATVVHLAEGATASMPDRMSNEFWRSQRRYYEKHLPWPNSLIALLLVAAVNAQLWLGMTLLRRLPSRLRPVSLKDIDPAMYRRQAIGALRGPVGPGFRELAAEWNERDDA